LNNVLRFLLLAPSGHWLAPWKSPYLRWRIETYSGMKAEQITFRDFTGFLWKERRNLLRYLRWVGRNSE
jgi:hypothetical protein